MIYYFNGLSITIEYYPHLARRDKEGTFPLEIISITDAWRIKHLFNRLTLDNHTYILNRDVGLYISTKKKGSNQYTKKKGSNQYTEKKALDKSTKYSIARQLLLILYREGAIKRRVEFMWNNNRFNYQQ